jgi:hypothetical protein
MTCAFRSIPPPTQDEDQIIRHRPRGTSGRKTSAMPISLDKYTAEGVRRPSATQRPTPAPGAQAVGGQQPPPLTTHHKRVSDSNVGELQSESARGPARVSMRIGCLFLATLSVLDYNKRSRRNPHLYVTKILGKFYCAVAFRQYGSFSQ